MSCDAVAGVRFRFCFRMCVFSLIVSVVPPLRERGSDISTRRRRRGRKEVGSLLVTFWFHLMTLCLSRVTAAPPRAFPICFGDCT